jgi:hypothetical protein
VNALMRLRVESSQANALLLCGIPFAEGAVEPGSGFVLLDAQEQSRPLWWEERAHWADGSIKWIFLHARLMGAEQELQLCVDAVRPATLTVEGASLSLDDMQVQFGQDLWALAVGDAGVEVQPGIAHASDVADSEAPFVLELVEPSPLAPLLRWHQQTQSGLRFDHLLRLDPQCGQIYWQQRLSFMDEDSCQLQHLQARLHFAHGAAWRFARGAKRRLEVLRPGYFSLDGGNEQEGHPQAALESGPLSVELVKGWQRAPFALTADGSRVGVEFYPPSAAPLKVHSGTSLRHEVRLGLRGQNTAPARWALDAEQACATGAFGPLMAQSERTQRLFPGYEQAIQAGLDGARHSRLDKERGQELGPVVALEDETDQDEEYFGLQHYGDWPMKLGSYKGERRMYADNEYDTPYAYFLQFVRTGRITYAEVAYHSAVHMADIDCKATNGDMHFHGYYEQAEDHAEHRTVGGDLGHYWTDGLVLNYLLCGDLWSWEAALGQTRYLLGIFKGEGDAAIRRHFLGCERSVGWPLTALAGVAEAIQDADILAKMRQMVAFLARFSADPDRELEEIQEIDGQPLQWWRIGQEDGSKPFMLGVVLEGLERYHRLTQDPAAEEAVVNISRFLVDVMWVEEVEAFTYEWNAFNRPHREDVYPHYINAMVAPGLAFAYELTGTPRFKEIATRAFHASLWTLFAPGGGKEIGMVGRTSALMVGRLHAWKRQREELRSARLLPSNGVAFSFAGSAEELDTCAGLLRREGVPHYESGALRSGGDSYAVYGFAEPVCADRGEIEFSFVPDWDCPVHPGPVAQRAYLHLCDRPFTRSCVSIISFYTGLHVRFYDAERHYIEVLETDIQHWRAGIAVQVRVEWDAEKGEAVLFLDGAEKDRRALGRRLSGAFKRLHLGHRPGNWRADGLINRVTLRLGE